MKKLQPFSHKISTVFVCVCAFIISFYTIVVELTVHHAENLNSQQRLSLVAPHHLSLFNNNKLEQVIQTDPITTIYSHFHLLPKEVQSYIDPQWSGVLHIVEEDLEASIFAMANQQGRITYAVEDVGLIEWSDFDFIVVEIALFVFGVILFVATTFAVIRLSKRLSQPFSELASQLQSESDHQLSPIVTNGEQSKELMQTLDGVNHFRARIKEALEREQSFTRYVSHELRTPMTVVKGSLSLLRRNEDPTVAKQVKRIEHAMEEMEQLTQTFLLLARDEEGNQSQCEISQEVIDNIEQNIAKRIASNNVRYQATLTQNISLSAEPILVKSLISNLVLNAVNCSINGAVTLVIDSNKLTVTDNGVGLDGKSRGYEGFGIGLNVVRDICNKYQWQFSLVNNPDQGCTATVNFTTDKTRQDY